MRIGTLVLTNTNRGAVMNHPFTTYDVNRTHLDELRRTSPRNPRRTSTFAYARLGSFFG